MDAVPRGLVTFLFTDIEGSTALWESDPQAMDRALRSHDELVTALVAASGGSLFSQAGDSFAAAFASAADAVAAAIRIQQAIDVLVEPVILRVRIGLHSGDSFDRDHNYFGPTLNRAARLMAAAHGGQIVCSWATAELAGPHLPGDVTLRLLGLFRLKDLLAPETVFQVEAPGLLTTFPSLRTLDSARHNLPVQQTRLIGRETETAAVIEALEQSRLVTLTGVGGCGKTRLALAAAADLAQTARDGVFFVALAPVTNAGGVVPAVTESMGARLAGETPTDLARFLERRHVLLVLDNCEHLLDEVADVLDEVLSTGATARVLATSREALGAVEERIVRVPSLPIEDGGERSSPAVALLVERMRSAAGSDGRIDESSGVLVEICRRLDGIPLAIELAAAQMSHMSPSELLERIDRRFELLVGGHGRRRQRQQTLQAIMDWSWHLLGIDERRFLAVCSVFSGDWSIDGAEAVGDPFVSDAAARVLPALVRKSLVEPVFSAKATRFRLLETVRLFAAGKLVDLGLAERARAVHAQFHLQRARVTSVDEAFLDLDVIDLVHHELSDIGAAIEWLTTRARSSEAAELVVLAGGCYSRAFSSRRGVTEVERLARLVDDPVLGARLLISGAFAAICTGEHVRTQEWAADARRLAVERDAFSFCDASVLAAAPLILVDPERARRLLVEADDVARRSGSTLCRGGVQLWLNIADLCVPELGLRVADAHDASGSADPAACPGRSLVRSARSKPPSRAGAVRRSSCFAPCRSRRPGSMTTTCTRWPSKPSPVIPTACRLGPPS